jgi:hypothetical protein
MKQIRPRLPPSLPFPVHYLLPADDILVCWGRLIKSTIEQIKTDAVYEVNEPLKSNEAIFLKSYFIHKSQQLHVFARCYNNRT